MESTNSTRHGLYALGEALVRWCERFLQWRHDRAARRAARQQRHRNTLVEWIKAFLWAAVMVLIINQYALQAYQIPSGSMHTTLLEGDRIFVGKAIYGPEVLPGVAKLPGFTHPHRGEVVIFENPSYVNRGILFELAQRLIYMLTLSVVDIDRDATGQQRAHFLIKRMIGDEGEYVRIAQGEFYFRPAGSTEWISEPEMMQRTNRTYTTQRLIAPHDYPALREAAHALALQELDLALTEPAQRALSSLWEHNYIDTLFIESEKTGELFRAAPHNAHWGVFWQRHTLGRYIPHGYMLPLGDNRDNSRDGRYFGVVAKKQVLGKARIKYWPPRRIGIIR